MSNYTFEVCNNSDTEIEVTWEVNEFLRKNSDGWITPEFPFAGFDCVITAKNREPFCISFGVLCRAPNPADPQVHCELALKSKEGTLHKLLIPDDDYHVTEEGTILFCKFPWPEFIEKKESLVPKGVLTIICKLSTQAKDGSSTIKGKPSNVQSKEGSSKLSDERRENVVSAKEVLNRSSASQLNASARCKIETFGKLKIRSDSSSRMDITWTVEDFFNLPCDLTKGVVSEMFELPGGRAFLAIHPYGTYDKPGLVQITITLVCPQHQGIRDPEVDCILTALKTSKHTLYKSLPSEDEEKMKELGCVFYRYLSLSEIVDRNVSLVPNGILTVLVRLRSHKFSPEEENMTEETSTDEESEEEKEEAAALSLPDGYIPTTSRGICSTEETGKAINKNKNSTDGKSAKKLGLLTTHINSPTYIEMTWNITDFLNLPDVGRVSDNFQILGGQGMVGLCPYGYNQNPGLTCFTVVLICEANTGIRNSEVDCEVALKTVDGELYNSLMEKDEVTAGPSACAFYRYFERSDILERKESLVPGGVLTACFKVRSRENAAEGSSTLMAVTPTTLEPKAGTSGISISRDDDFEGILRELRISGKDKDLTIRVDRREFRTYMSILMVRTPVFAAEIQKRLTDSDTRIVNIDDLCSSSTFEAFLQFVNTGQVQLLSTDIAFELYIIADKFKVDELKEQCAKYAEKDNSIPEIYVG